MKTRSSSGLITPSVVAMLVVLAATAWAVEPGVYDLQADHAAHRAANPTQGFDAWIGAEQVRVRPHDGGWELDLALVSVGRDGALHDVEAAGLEARGQRAELHRGALVEWYVNTEQGLEQGFTIHQRPPGDGPLVLEMALAGGLLARVEDDRQAVTLLPPGGSLAVLRYSKLRVEDSAGLVLEAWLETAPGVAQGEPKLRIVTDDAGAECPLWVDPLLTSPAWTSADSEMTSSVAWGDWDSDGDLDLAAGNWDQPNRVYANSGGTLTSAWTSADTDDTRSVAWGDWDGDGDLDLAAGNFDQPIRVYSNGWLNRPGGLPETPTSPVLIRRPGCTDAAFGYSSAEYLGSPVVIPFTLYHEQSDPAWQIVPEYSLSGGGQWLPATGPASSTTYLEASPGGSQHLFEWDSLADGVLRAENVVFRIGVLWQAPERVSDGLQRAEMAAVSPPFRVWNPSADLALDKSDGQSSAVPGETVT